MTTLEYPGFKKRDDTVIVGQLMNKEEFEDYLKVKGLRPMTKEEYQYTDDKRCFIYDLNSDQMVQQSTTIPDDVVRKMIEIEKEKIKNLSVNKELDVDSDKKD